MSESPNSVYPPTGYVNHVEPEPKVVPEETHEEPEETEHQE